jgi:hypothetical protein
MIADLVADDACEMRTAALAKKWRRARVHASVHHALDVPSQYSQRRLVSACLSSMVAVAGARSNSAVGDAESRRLNTRRRARPSS